MASSLQNFIDFDTNGPKSSAYSNPTGQTFLIHCNGPSQDQDPVTTPSGPSISGNMDKSLLAPLSPQEINSICPSTYSSLSWPADSVHTAGNVSFEGMLHVQQHSLFPAGMCYGIPSPVFSPLSSAANSEKTDYFLFDDASCYHELDDLSWPSASDISDTSPMPLSLADSPESHSRVMSESDQNESDSSCRPEIVMTTSHQTIDRSPPTTNILPAKHGRMSRRSKSGRPSPHNATKRGSSNKTLSGPIFTCSFSHYGCLKLFTSKNEWKRHVTSQHLQLGFYRCDVGSCSSAQRTNDFNRKDLFIMHQRRMHAPWVSSKTRKPSSKSEEEKFDQDLEQVQRRCWREQRKPPERSQCGFCGVCFFGPHSWSKRMEHIGRHFETGNVTGLEREDPYLRQWAIEEDIIQPDGLQNWKLACLLE